MTGGCIVLHPVFKQRKDMARDPDACLEEAIGLAHAIDLEIAATAIVTIAQVKPSTLMGSGKVEEVAAIIAECGAGLAIMNCELSPVQQRNLEKAWNCKVIDRTALILEIFGARARTHEGKLQVELAALDYQKSRLVRSWTHLERQRGGFGFLGGPGESQIEIDRRLIRDRMAKLRNQLEQVARTRELHRKTRRDTPYPVVALVGYTNAGKSTLFNRLTGANVLSMDKLFATLDPTMRGIKLPSGMRIILSDTVGFVSDLPTELVAAFRATLEEVLEAEILLHVRDISHPDAAAQKADVEAVLKSLLKTEDINAIEVYNKIDRLEPQQKLALREKNALTLSALTGEGVDELQAMLDKELSARLLTQKHLRLHAGNGKLLAWLHAHGKVVAQRAEGDYIYLTVQMSEENLQRFNQLRHVTS